MSPASEIGLGDGGQLGRQQAVDLVAQSPRQVRHLRRSAQAAVQAVPDLVDAIPRLVGEQVGDLVAGGPVAGRAAMTPSASGGATATRR